MYCKSLQKQAQIVLPELGTGTFNGLTLPMYPHVVLSPSFATVAADITVCVATMQCRQGLPVSLLCMSY